MCLPIYVGKEVAGYAAIVDTGVLRGSRKLLLPWFSWIASGRDAVGLSGLISFPADRDSDQQCDTAHDIA
jgi:hypothetical protein